MLYRTAPLDIMRLIAIILAIQFSLITSIQAAVQPPSKLNILLITADDMNWDSIGAYGSPVEDITPHLDQLAKEGMRFLRSHVNIAVCFPSRSVWMTGLYPHRNGSMGFNDIKPEVSTLPEELKRRGYFIGLMGKHNHVVPSREFVWDALIDEKDLGEGRSPKLYYESTKNLLAQAKTSGSPFFLMVNSHDPHRPFAASNQEHVIRDNIQPGGIITNAGLTEELAPGDYTEPPGKEYLPEDIPVPGFVPDLPEIRLELAEYYASVHRADEIVGATLQALEEAGFASNTLVIFVSDNGVSLPFAKSNTYLNSTRAGMIVRWPGRVEANSVNEEDFIPGIDIMPTILDAAKLTTPKGLDGRSALPVLLGQKGSGRKQVFTYYFETSAGREYPMRAILDAEYGYIYNAWSNGETVYKNESQSGRAWEAMKTAAKTDPLIAERIKLFTYRAPEEFYNYAKDNDALKNLINAPEYAVQIRKYRELLLAHMQDTDDPLLGEFKAFIKSRH